VSVLYDNLHLLRSLSDTSLSFFSFLRAKAATAFSAS